MQEVRYDYDTREQQEEKEKLTIHYYTYILW